MVISMLVKTATGTEGEFNAASNGKANSVLLLGIALIPSVGIIPLCPKPSEYSLSQGKVRDKRFRIKYIVALAILTAIAVGLIALGYPVYANMIACGMIGTVIMVTDCCSSIISQIWKLIDGV